MRSLRRWVGVICMITAAAVCSVATNRPARAVPSFALQTGQPCASCHIGAFGPQLTDYGREFKLRGYVQSGGNWEVNGWPLPPLAATVIGSFNRTGKNLPKADVPPHFSSNDNFALDQASLYYGGAIYGELGAFIQGTYDGVARETALDNADIRFAHELSVLGSNVVVGLDVNNNPTVQDLWNSTPAWTFPYTASAIAPSPAAKTQIDSTFGQQVGGAGIYTDIDETLYLEFTGYTTLSGGLQRTLGTNPQGENRIDGLAPYWRAALHRNFGDYSAEVGTYGLWASVTPQRQTGSGNDTYTDAAYDFNFTYTGLEPDHTFQLYGTMINEWQNLNASKKLGLTSKGNNTLSAFRLTGTYVFDKTYKLNTQYFNTWGGRDPTLYAPGGVDGSRKGEPNSSGIVAEVDFIPFGKDDSILRPWANLDLGLQYVHYLKFNGSSSNYNGDGRRASDNDTIYLFAWLAF